MATRDFKFVTLLDLDDTLFRIGDNMISNLIRNDNLEWDSDYYKRAGLEKALRNLNDMGSYTAIVTKSGQEYGERIFEILGLRHLVNEISEFDSFFDVDIGNYKIYSGVLDSIGCFRYFPQVIRDKVIVVGNTKYDRPSKTEGLGFIHEPEAMQHDAVLTVDIIKKLFELGDGSFYEGFRKILGGDLGIRIAGEEGKSRFKLTDRIAASVSTQEDGRFPILSDIKADSYRRNFEQCFYHNTGKERKLFPYSLRFNYS